MNVTDLNFMLMNLEGEVADQEEEDLSNAHTLQRSIT